MKHQTDVKGESNMTDKAKDVDHISLTEVAEYVWHFMEGEVNTHGLFPPAIVIDQNDSCNESELGVSLASMTGYWIWDQADDGFPNKLIAPVSIQCNIYYNTLMTYFRTVWDMLIPENVLCIQLVDMLFHEYTHYLNWNARYRKIAKSKTWEERKCRLRDMYDLVQSIPIGLGDDINDERHTEQTAINLTWKFAITELLNNHFTPTINGRYDRYMRIRSESYKEISTAVEYLQLAHTSQFDPMLEREEAQIERRMQAIIEYHKSRAQKSGYRFVLDP